MHPPPWQKGKGLEIICLWELDFKSRGEGLLSGGTEFSEVQVGAKFSEGQVGAKFSEGARFLKASYHAFLQTSYFCGNSVIYYSCHYIYSNIFDIAEF